MYVAGSLSSYIRPLVYAPVYLRLSLAYAVSLSFREIELIVALMFSLFPLFPDAVAVKVLLSPLTVRTYVAYMQSRPATCNLT